MVSYQAVTPSLRARNVTALLLYVAEPGQPGAWIGLHDGGDSGDLIGLARLVDYVPPRCPIAPGSFVPLYEHLLPPAAVVAHIRALVSPLEVQALSLQLKPEVGQAKRRCSHRLRKEAAEFVKRAIHQGRFLRPDRQSAPHWRLTPLVEPAEEIGCQRNGQILNQLQVSVLVDGKTVELDDRPFTVENYVDHIALHQGGQRKTGDQPLS